MPADLKERLAQVNQGKMTPSKLLDRAWVYNEYALSTPGFKGDEALFSRSRADLNRILRSRLGRRHQVRFEASMLLHYEDIFKRRANDDNIPNKARRNLQQKLGTLMLDFLGERDLIRREYGQLSELVAITYLLDSDLMPYIGSRREEANIIQDDNHDFYTLHESTEHRYKRRLPPLNFARK